MMIPQIRQYPGAAGKSSSKNNDGVALILALLIVAVLSAIVVQFSYESQVAASSTGNHTNDLEAYLAAKSAVANGISLLQEDLLDAQQNGMPEYDGPMDQWAAGVPFVPLNTGQMRATIADEYGKINLNAIVRADPNGGPPTTNQQLVNALHEFFRFRMKQNDKDPVDAIIDWLDYNDDEQEQPDGAENEYYQGLENPYSCKNGPMDSIEELLLIKGITPELYYGDIKEGTLPLSEYMTVHGDWQGRVNINTARQEVIAAVIAGYQGQPITDAIIQQAIDIQQNATQQPQGAYTDTSQLPALTQQAAVPGSTTGTTTGATTGTTTAGGLANLPSLGKPPSGLSNFLSPKSAAPVPVADSALLDTGAAPAAAQTQAKAGVLSSIGLGTATKPTTTPVATGVNGLPSGLGGAQQPISAWTVSSNVFRIYGDGMADNVMVRIEAYVWRTPMNFQQLQATLPVQEQAVPPPAEPFRILDWKIIR